MAKSKEAPAAESVAVAKDWDVVSIELPIAGNPLNEFYRRKPRPRVLVDDMTQEQRRGLFLFQNGLIHTNAMLSSGKRVESHQDAIKYFLEFLAATAATLPDSFDESGK